MLTCIVSGHDAANDSFSRRLYERQKCLHELPWEMSKSLLKMIARKPGSSFPEQCPDYSSGIVPVGSPPGLPGAILLGEVSIAFRPDFATAFCGLGWLLPIYDASLNPSKLQIKSSTGRCMTIPCTFAVCVGTANSFGHIVLKFKERKGKRWSSESHCPPPSCAYNLTFGYVDHPERFIVICARLESVSSTLFRHVLSHGSFPARMIFVRLD